jgi:predicted TIM-barrel fold metal-dependent hydrolase
MDQHFLSRRMSNINTSLASGTNLFGSILSQESSSPESFKQPKLQDKEPLIIDANTGLGRFADGLNSDLAQTEKTLRHLRAAGINIAIAYSVLSRQTDAKEGNAIILEEAKKHPELIASCVITPYEMPIDSVLDSMNRNQIKIARLFPNTGHFSVSPSIIGSIVEKLQNENKVLFIDFESLAWSGSAINYDAVYQLCRAYPKIPIVLIGSTILGSRNYPQMLDECTNLYLEISQILQPEGVIRLVQNGYGRRLIFGSGFPVREPGALLNMLAYSGLPPNALEDICSGNLLRLLNIEKIMTLLSI